MYGLIVSSSSRTSLLRWTQDANEGQASISIPNVSSSGTLGYENVLYAQDANDQIIKGYDITFNAENSKVESDSAFDKDAEAGIPNAGLDVAVQSSSTDGDDLLVFYQTSENQLVEYRRKLSDTGSGGWSSSEIQIPYN